MKSFDSTLDDIIWGVNHDAFDDRLGKSLHRAWQVGAGDDTVVGLIKERIHSLRVKEAFGHLCPFRKSRNQHGDFLLGFDSDQNPIMGLLRSLNAGLLIAANTGSGKSNLLMFFALQFARSTCQIWLSEMYKRQLRSLLPLFTRCGRELIILAAKQWRINPLQAGDCDPRAHLAVISDILVRVLGLPARARSIINQVCHELYRQFGCWTGNQRGWPTLFDVYEFIRKHSELNAAAREATLDRLGSLLVSLTPSCAAFRVGWKAADLARFSIVFEMGGTAETIKQILLETTLYSVLRSEVERGRFNQQMDLFVAFEDSQRFFGGAEPESGVGISSLEELAGVIRGGGKGLGGLVQTLHGLSPRMISNLSTKIMGRLGTASDYQQLGADMGMTRDQIEWSKRNLKPGTFICQLPEGNWREPFVLNVPLLPNPAYVGDAEAAESLRPINALPVVPAAEFQRWEPHHIIEVSNSQFESTTPRLSETELRFLGAVTKQPGRASGFYARAANVNGAKAAEIRQRLVDLLLICEHSVATNARGRNSIVLEPLESAFELLRNSNATKS